MRRCCEVGTANKNVIVIDADLAKSTFSWTFGKVFPERFFNIGIQEANMIGIASGLASSGKIPFISSFAAFILCKGFDQLRMGAAYPKLNVKVAGSHGGISIGEDGVSQQSVEDVALACALPGFVGVHSERRAHHARGRARGGGARRPGVPPARQAEDVHRARAEAFTSSSGARSSCATGTRSRSWRTGCWWRRR